MHAHSSLVARSPCRHVPRRRGRQRRRRRFDGLCTQTSAAAVRVVIGDVIRDVIKEIIRDVIKDVIREVIRDLIREVIREAYIPVAYASATCSSRMGSSSIWCAPLKSSMRKRRT